MKKKLFVLLLALLTIGQAFAEERAHIYLLRPFDFGAAMAAVYGGKKYYQMQHWIDLNGHKFGVVNSLTYYKIEVEPGSYTITGYVGNLPYEDIKKNQPNYSLTINSSAGQDYYINIDEKKFKISQIDKNKFMKLQQGSNPIQYAGFIAYLDDKFYTEEGKLIDEKTGKILEDGQNQLAQGGPQNFSPKKERVLSDVDQNIPTSKKSSDDTFALIIANEDYQFVDPVKFASHDGEVFKEYCIKTLGIPEKQVRYCANASYGIISGGVDWLCYALNNFENSRAIVYYCGHGIPNEKTGDAYIIPVDGKGTNTATCYSLNKLYKTLADTKASNITYFMDACFTGANKEGSMLVAARGVAREAKEETLDGNTIVFSASSGDETAMTYEEKGHGLFTYYLLRKLQQTSGNVTYSELAFYIRQNVKKEAFLINEKPQTPVVATSPDAASTWKTMKLK